MAETFICPKEWKLTRQEAFFVEALMDADDLVMRADLHHQIAPYAEPKIVDVVLCHVRRKLRRFGVEIISVYGKRLRIPAEIKDALRNGAVSFDDARAA